MYQAPSREFFTHPFRRRFHYAVCTLFSLWYRVVWDLRLHDMARIPSHDTDYIVAANHLSNWDPPLIASTFLPTQVAFLGKIELFGHPLLAWVMDSLAVICLDRAKVAVSTIKLAKLAASQPGWCLGIFPEGTRRRKAVAGESEAEKAAADATHAAQQIEAKKGVAFMAKMTGAPVLPVAIWTVPKGPGLFARAQLHMAVGELLPFPKSGAKGEAAEAELTAFTQTLMATIEALKVKPL